MADKLTHSNLQSNPYAVYCFKEEGEGYSGKRIYLKKTQETDDENVIKELRRSCHCKCDENNQNKKFLVYFDVEKILPLIGA